MKNKILFISKKKMLTYSDCNTIPDGPISSGLTNSINFVLDLLKELKIESNYEMAVDGNCIDKFLTIHKPTVLILEAIWVTPEKIAQLQKLHPKVLFMCRIHSQITFLANEGIAMDWLYQYRDLNVIIACNHKSAVDDLSKVGINSVLLPNYYKITKNQAITEIDDRYINISCFGAIRPMKNHLAQAISAMYFADVIGKKLRFFINVNREEQGGNSVLKNLRNLFKNSEHDLVECPWMTHVQFIDLVKTMDIGMQVSLSETFNIVAADLIDNNIPMVVSKEIFWLPFYTKAKATSIDSIVFKLMIAYYFGRTKVSKFINKLSLKYYNYNSKKLWKEYFQNYLK
jgi:hypothetical protein